MNILVLGGTVFLGRHIVDEALRRGDSVTIFTRGRHNPELFPEAEHLLGDRDGDLDALRGRRWDVAIDTCGYFPRVVRASAELLADAVEHYTFVSSISVYPDFARPDADETAPVGVLEDPTVEQITGETYGPLKALCEQAAEVAMPGRVCSVRAGLIVGPNDPTDRFTYWPHRIAQGGDVLAPGTGEEPVQFIDVRDLAAWIISMAGRRTPGVYNATGPASPLTMGTFLDRCRAVTGSDANLVWVDKSELIARGVELWTEIPMSVPDVPEMQGFSRMSCARAIAQGLRFRPVDETIADTLAWDRTRPEGNPLHAGLAPEREEELLAELAH
jgi:2'-hydroxyisoflavone reductase